MIKRHIESQLKKLATQYPVITLTGPRQSGKTTLAKMAFPTYTYISMEDPMERALAQTDPKEFFYRYNSHIIIDEVQQVPDLFSYIQTLVDEDPIDGRFILTGSEQFLMDQKISQSLAGRTAILKLLPLSLSELYPSQINDYWKNQQLVKKNVPQERLFEVIFNGFYPRIHDKQLNPTKWYMDYYDTYISRDVRQLLNVGDLKSFGIFIKLLAGRSAGLLNLTSLGNDAGVSQPTAKRWLSILQTCYIIDILYPYYNNFGKRMIKAPKVYFLDSGLLCTLLNIRQSEDIMIHPLRGQIFETYVYSEMMKTFTHCGESSPLYFWQNSQKKEVDMVIDLGTVLHAVEIKSGMSIQDDFFTNLYMWQKITHMPSSNMALIYGGDEYLRFKNVQIVPWYGIS